MVYFILGVIAVIGIPYIIFTSRKKALSKAMKLILSGQEDRVVIKQGLGKIKSIINAHFTDIISTGNAIAFGDNKHTFIVSPLSDNEVLLSLMPSDDEIEEYAKLEEEIFNDVEAEENKSNARTIADVAKESRATRAGIGRYTPLMDTTVFEWLIGAQNALGNDNRDAALQRLTHAFLTLEEDGDYSNDMREYIMLLIQYVDDNDFQSALNEMIQYNEELAKVTNSDRHSVEISAMESFSHKLDETRKIVQERDT